MFYDNKPLIVYRIIGLGVYPQVMEGVYLSIGVGIHLQVFFFVFLFDKRQMLHIQTT
jgi:hypothetical protein